MLVLLDFMPFTSETLDALCYLSLCNVITVVPSCSFCFVLTQTHISTETQEWRPDRDTVYHMIPAETPHLTPIRPDARLWNEFLCSVSVS